MYLAAAGLAVSFLSLLLAGLAWRQSRIRIESSSRNWDDQIGTLRAGVAEARALGVDGRTRSASAEASANHSAAASEAAARAAEQSALSAERSANAASEATAAIQALAESGRRAWVHAVDFRLTLKTQQNENSSLEVSIANLGATPARELRVSSNFLICDETPEDLPLKPRVSNIALGPGVSFSLSHFLRVSQADLMGVTTGRKVLLACGKAQYRDVFDVERETRWCASYDYSVKAFVAADRHNLTT